MNRYKEFKEKHPDIRFVIILIILLIVMAVSITLIFVLPTLLKPKVNRRSRSVSPDIITDTTHLESDNSLILTLSEGETVKISSNSESKGIPNYNNPKYIYVTSSSSTYYIDIEYSVTDLAIEELTFEVTLSDRDGNNKRSPSNEDVSITGNKYRYTVNGGGTDIAINTIGISYIVKRPYRWDQMIGENPIFFINVKMWIFSIPIFILIFLFNYYFVLTKYKYRDNSVDKK